jgi:hypothetical protein
MKRSDDNLNYNLRFSKIIDSKIKHEDAQLFLEKVVDEKYEYFTANIIKEDLINQPINFINANLNLIICIFILEYVVILSNNYNIIDIINRIK